jgi:hypothetical protein
MDIGSTPEEFMMSCRTTPWWAAPALALFLAACGGGSSSGGFANGSGAGSGDADGGGSSSPPAASSVSGTAAVGAALQNAAVSLLCNGGQTQTATAGTDGSYSITLPSPCAAPYLLRATGLAGGLPVTLYAYADTAGRVNLTTFSLLVASAANPARDLAAVYSAIASGSEPVGASWTASIAASALGQAGQVLAALLGGQAPPAVTAAWLNQAFSAAQGDAFDGLLETFQSRLGGASLDSVLEQILQRGGSPRTQPWKVLFGTGSTMTFSGTGCSATIGPSGPYTATFTLTAQADGVAVTARLGDAGATVVSDTFSTATGMSWNLQLSGGQPQPPAVLWLAPSGSVSRGFRLAPSETPAISLRQSSPNNGVISCQSVTNPVQASQLSHFDMTARLGNFTGNTALAQTCAAVPNYAPAFSFAASAAGQFSLNGSPVPADWLATAGNRYSESLSFSSGALVNGGIYVPSGSFPDAINPGFNLPFQSPSGTVVATCS